EQVNITNGSVIGLRGTAASNLGNMDIAAGSALIAYQGLVLAGNLTAAGRIDLSGAAQGGPGSATPGTELAVGGNFTGGGEVILDVSLAEAQLLSSDRLVIGGNVTGQTTLVMNNVTPGRGAATTGDGILLVQVDGTAAADAFTLSGPITSGAFVYDLDFGGQADSNNNFYLVSSGLTPDGAITQAAPFLIATAFTDLPGLVKRRAGRVPIGQDNGAVADGPLESLTGAWAQVEGGRNKLQADNADRYSTDLWSLKAGYDADAGLPLPGKLIVGGYLTYVSAEDTVDSHYGARAMSSQAIGAGITATYYAEDGSYADMQGRVMGVRSDLDEKSGVLSSAAAASLELGHVFALGSDASLIPSAQLQYGDTRASAFEADDGTKISGFGDSRLAGRLGMALQATLGATPESGPLLTASLDYIRDLSPDIGVTVDDVNISTELPPDWIEAGLSLDLQLGEDALLELRASYTAAFGESLADNSSLGASANFRIGF
ncbi:autotransporter outer membrane beta-barrel domain-containing protein, partial [Aestuariivirga sp.]|uniref:autotransporter outer membrane beta-barrel domain-containing protein n=1 Tax=Aestuariivirga sp. TaxID=2650926 RepID=UPI00301ABA06